MKITRRLLLPTLAFMAFVILTLLSIQAWLENRRITQNEQDKLQTLQHIFNNRLQTEEDFAVALALASANAPEIQAAFAALDREALIALTLPAYEQLDARFGIPQYQFHLPPATSFLRLHQLDRFDDDLSSFRQTVLQANARQEIVSGLEVGRGGMGLRGVAPVTYQGRHIGTVEFGVNVDQLLLDALKEEYNADWQILLRRDRAELAVEGFVATTPGPIPELILQASTLATPLFNAPDAYSQALSDESVSTRQVLRDEENYSLISAPLHDFSGDVIGVVDILIDRSALAQAQQIRNLVFLASVIGALAIVGFGLSWIIGYVLRPVGHLTKTAAAIASGDRTVLAPVNSQDELGVLGTTFNLMTGQLHTLIDTLEERVDARTHDLTISAEVSRSLSTILDSEQLVQEVVRQVRNAFGYYHVQIYIFDEAAQQLRMAGGTGTAGQTMLAAGHKLSLGQGLVGQVAIANTPILVPDISQDRQWLPNPLLPDTRAEAAVPISIGDTLLGVLDVQHNVPDGLTQASVDLLQSIANQVAIALQNAYQFGERRRAQAEASRFRMGIEQSSEAVFLTDVQGKIMYINPAFTQMYGYDESEAIGQTPRILKSGITLPAYYQHFWDTLLAKQPVLGETVNKTKDGRFLTIESANNPIINEDGDLVGFLAIHNDVTMRRDTETQLARSIAELNCLNDIGRQAEKQLPIPEFLTWVAQRIPAATTNPETCIAAITLGDSIYGVADTLSQPRHMVEGLRIGGEQIGRLYIAYTNPTLTFADADSSFIGSIGQRISSYIESQRLLVQLERRAAEMEIVAQIGTAVAATRDPQTLLQTMADLTKEQFGLYHVHIFLLNDKQELLLQAAGSGAIGQQIVASRAELSLQNQQSLIARAVRLREHIVVNDVLADPDYLAKPLLPDTRAELVIPMIASDQVLGALDLQANATNFFSADDVNIYTTLATQAAIALQNAQRYLQTQVALEEVNALQRAMTQTGWEQLRQQARLGFTASSAGVTPLEPDGRATPATTAVTVSGLTIGQMGVYLPPDRQLAANEQALLSGIAQQVGQALERARLSAATQQALAATEQRQRELALLNDMGRALTAQTDVDGVLDVIYEHIGRLMDATNFYIALYEPTLNEIEFALNVTGNQVERHTDRRRLGQGLTEYLLHTRQPLLLPDNVRERLVALGIQPQVQESVSWLGAPLVLGEQVLGVIGLQSYTTPHLYNEQHRDLLTAVANQAAIAIENARLIEATEERAQQEQMLREMTARVGTAVDAEMVLRTAAEEIGRAFGLETFIYLEGDKQEIDTAVPHSTPANGNK